MLPCCQALPLRRLNLRAVLSRSSRQSLRCHTFAAIVRTGLAYERPFPDSCRPLYCGSAECVIDRLFLLSALHHVLVENAQTPFTRTCPRGRVRRLPITCDGCFVNRRSMNSRSGRARTVVLRYVDAPASRATRLIRTVDAIISGVATIAHCFWPDPHPEHAVEKWLAVKAGSRFSNRMRGGTRACRASGGARRPIVDGGTRLVHTDHARPPNNASIGAFSGGTNIY